MPLVNCRVCSGLFYAKPYHLKKGWGKYCSKKCNNEGQRNGRMFPCHTCKQGTYRTPKDQSKSKSGRFFCNKSCQTLWRNSIYVRERHPNWKGGTATYRDILLQTKVVPMCKRCKSEDMRVMTAHHKDRNRINNSPSNLIWLCRNCHYLVHNYKNESKHFISA